MINEISSRDELKHLYVTKSRNYILCSVHKGEVDAHISEGWQVVSEAKRYVKMKKDKTHDVLLEDRVWCLLYKMGFLYLSNEKGAYLALSEPSTGNITTQLDVVAIDNEVGLAIECKSAITQKKKSSFIDEVGKHNLIRSRFSQAMSSQYPTTGKRIPVLVMFTYNIVLSDNDHARADDANVVVFDGNDLDYYEKLVAHLGYAARYQFLSDILPKRTINGLHCRVPAIRTRFAGVNCYVFSINPEYLLKIAFVSHRAKGHGSDVTTYQRMISKGRLSKIQDYISDGGVFPTNIVINFDKSYSKVKFERIKQEDGQEDAILGWLDIIPTYRAAWIIDGQHRLFSYAGHPLAKKSKVSVLAFDGLLPSKQAQMFIDINGKQKRVKQSHLQELYAELHWDAEDDSTRIRAIISKAIAILDSDIDSPFRARIQKADETRSTIRCISIAAIFGSLEKSGFYITKERHGSILEYGPLWQGDNRRTLNRTVKIIKEWFGEIRDRSNGWWDIGSEKDGGGLAMNDSVIALLLVLKSVFESLDKGNSRLVTQEDNTVIRLIRPYAIAAGDYLGSLSEEKRKTYRANRGVQGQTARMREIQNAIRITITTFEPDGLDKWLEERSAVALREAKDIIDRVESTVQKTVIERLKEEIGEDEKYWWMDGVPEKVRLEARDRWEKDKGKRGDPDKYLMFIDYRDILLSNWSIFQNIFGYGRGNKKDRTVWIHNINEVRKAVVHRSSQQHVSIEQLEQLRAYDEWITQQIDESNVAQYRSDTNEVDDNDMD